MRAATKRIVQNDDVARLHRQMIDGRAHGQRHRAKMHRQMITLRDGLARGVIDRAGVVETLLDVRREAGAAERDSHLFRDGDEEVFEDFELDWIKTHPSPPIVSREDAGAWQPAFRRRQSQTHSAEELP